MEENKKPENLFAFPMPAHGMPESYQGMTLRDYFAAKAVQSLIPMNWGSLKNEDAIEAWAKASYMVADAMLKEREK